MPQCLKSYTNALSSVVSKLPVSNGKASHKRSRIQQSNPGPIAQNVEETVERFCA